MLYIKTIVLIVVIYSYCLHEEGRHAHKLLC